MSKLGKLGHFFKQVGHIAPVILAFTPLAPIAAPVAAAIQEAEAIHGAGTGAGEARACRRRGRGRRKVANTAAGKVVLDPALIQDSAQHAIAAVISATKAAQNGDAQAV
jgi:hypothetical protein